MSQKQENRVTMEITVAQLKAMRDRNEKVFLLDVRTQEEWNTAHITGATLLPLHLLQEQLSALKEKVGKQKIIAYCHTGRRSATATAMLRSAGMDAYSLAGGIDAWSAIDHSVPRY